MTDDELSDEIQNLIKAGSQGHTRRCATCKHWDQMQQEEASHIGLCWNIPKQGKAVTKRGHIIGANIVPVGTAGVTAFGLRVEIPNGFAPVTTDLSLCSKWEQKDESQSE